MTHTNDSSTPLRNFVFYFVETITVLVVETNHSYQCYLDSLDEGHSVGADIAETKLFVFTRNNSTSLDQFFMPFGSSILNMTEIDSSFGLGLYRQQE